MPDRLFLARFGVDADNFLSIVREVREIIGRAGRLVDYTRPYMSVRMAEQPMSGRR
jgi:hypothetical protein